MAKPSLAARDVIALLERVFGERPASVERLVEGLESQAFRFELGGRALVVRINPSIRGFEKDRWAHDRLGRAVGVPAVVALGWADAEHAYCVSEWFAGVTLEALSASDAERVVGDVARTWGVIAEADVSSVQGFGDFDTDGRASAGSWREVSRRRSSTPRTPSPKRHTSSRRTRASSLAAPNGAS